MVYFKMHVWPANIFWDLSDSYITLIVQICHEGISNDRRGRNVRRTRFYFRYASFSDSRQLPSYILSIRIIIFGIVAIIPWFFVRASEIIIDHCDWYVICTISTHAHVAKPFCETHAPIFKRNIILIILNYVLYYARNWVNIREKRFVRSRTTNQMRHRVSNYFSWWANV